MLLATWRHSTYRAQLGRLAFGNAVNVPAHDDSRKEKSPQGGLGWTVFEGPRLVGRADLGAELALAGNHVVIPAHLDSGAVAQEEGCLITGIHLRALGAAITLIFERAERDTASNILVSDERFVEELCIAAF